MLFRKPRTDYARLANSSKVLALAANRFAEVFEGYAGGPIAEDDNARQVYADLALITSHIRQLQASIACHRVAGH